MGAKLVAMKKLLFSAVLVALFVFSYCVQPPDYPVEPVITYIGISKTAGTAPQGPHNPLFTLNQGQGYEDSLFVTFSFTDGDGDLGFPETDPTASVFIYDSRDTFPKPPIQLPYVEPLGAGNGISGEITVKLPTTCCIYTSPEGIKFPCEEAVQIAYDTFYYFIKIRDRAGHESNEIKTELIRLKCQ